MEEEASEEEEHHCSSRDIVVVGLTMADDALVASTALLVSIPVHVDMSLFSPPPPPPPSLLLTDCSCYSDRCGSVCGAVEGNCGSVQGARSSDHFRHGIPGRDTQETRWRHSIDTREILEKHSRDTEETPYCY